MSTDATAGTTGDPTHVERRGGAIDVTHRTTGKRARFDELHRFVVRDGTIVHVRPYLDTATLIEAFRP